MFKKVVSCLTFLFVFNSSYALSGSITPDAIEERLTEVGTVEVDGASGKKKSSKAELTPDKIYKKYCAVCHNLGVAGAPKKGDAAAWKTRQAQGWDTLLKNAVQGYKAMPKMGTCTKCTEQQIADTIKYMID